MAIEKEFFRQVMGRFATGVTVVTAKSSIYSQIIRSVSHIVLRPLQRNAMNVSAMPGIMLRQQERPSLTTPSPLLMPEWWQSIQVGIT